MQMKLVELKCVETTFSVAPVWHEVNLTICSGDFLRVISPNGRGKTTLLKVILGLLKPKKGEVKYYQPRENLFGYLPQRNDFDSAFPMTVEEVVLSGLFTQKSWWLKSRRKDKQKVREMLEKDDLAHYAKTPIGSLYGDTGRA